VKAERKERLKENMKDFEGNIICKTWRLAAYLMSVTVQEMDGVVMRCSVSWLSNAPNKRSGMSVGCGTIIVRT